jgi:hypothetical protein
MTDEQIMTSYKRACERDFTMEITETEAILVYPIAKESENQDMIKAKWFKLVDILIERKLI